ncbi:MAG: hypothetical protein WD360_02660 [Nitriliruptoraceae bacterium]
MVAPLGAALTAAVNVSHPARSVTARLHRVNSGSGEAQDVIAAKRLLRVGPQVFTQVDRHGVLARSPSHLHAADDGVVAVADNRHSLPVRLASNATLPDSCFGGTTSRSQWNGPFLPPTGCKPVLRVPLTPATIAAYDVGTLTKLFQIIPALHRFPKAMAERVHLLANALVDAYDGDAERLWQDVTDAQQLKTRLEARPGFGAQKAAIFWRYSPNSVASPQTAGLTLPASMATTNFVLSQTSLTKRRLNRYGRSNRPPSRPQKKRG